LTTDQFITLYNQIKIINQITNEITYFAMSFSQFSLSVIGRKYKYNCQVQVYSVIYYYYYSSLQANITCQDSKLER